MPKEENRRTSIERGNSVNKTKSPLICHFEMGGTLGGSYLALEKYLRYCDPEKFRHQVIFYRRPAGVEPIVAGRWPTVCLGLTVPALEHKKSGIAPGLHNGTWHSKLKRSSTARNLVNTARMIVASIRQRPVAWAIARFIQERDCALVNINNHFTYQAPTLAACTRCRIPAVSHYRTIQSVTWPDLWLSRNVECIVPINEACNSHLASYPFRAPITLVHDLVEDPPDVDPAEVLRLRNEILQGKGNIIVGTVTRLDEDRKGVREFLHAASALNSGSQQAVWVIVGDGKKASEYKQVAQTLGISDRVMFLGHRTNPFPYYKCMDIFVCPSLAEGGPYTVLEAMQCGCAVVSTRVGQVPLWINNGEDGLIVEPGDIAGLATSIGNLIADADARSALGANAAMSIGEKQGSPIVGAAKLDTLFENTLELAGHRYESPARTRRSYRPMVVAGDVATQPSVMGGPSEHSE